VQNSICSSEIEIGLFMNQQIKLNKLYRKYWKNVTSIINQHPALSGPILIKISEKYINSEIKLMIIGQQTLDWWQGNIKRLLNKYEKFNFAENYYSSPFWNVIRKVEKIIRIAPYSIVRSNLIKCDYKKTRPPYKIENELQKAFPVLEDEIKILKPDMVIFFTGPNYDYNLMEALPGTKLIKMNKYNSIKLCRIINSNCPYHSYRTYHPNYLRRSGNESKFLEFIKEIRV
jgi:hypothetical protein